MDQKVTLLFTRAKATLKVSSNAKSSTFAVSFDTNRQVFLMTLPSEDHLNSSGRLNSLALVGIQSRRTTTEFKTVCHPGKAHILGC